MFSQLQNLVNDPSFPSNYISLESQEGNANLNINVNVTSNFSQPQHQMANSQQSNSDNLVVQQQQQQQQLQQQLYRQQKPQQDGASIAMVGGPSWFDDFQDELEETQNQIDTETHLMLNPAVTEFKDESAQMNVRSASFSSISSFNSPDQNNADLFEQQLNTGTRTSVCTVLTTPEDYLNENKEVKLEDRQLDDYLDAHTGIKMEDKQLKDYVEEQEPVIKRRRKRSTKMTKEEVRVENLGKIKKPMTTIQRKAHNKIERKYRININSKIASLQKLVPWMSNENVAFEVDSTSKEESELIQSCGKDGKRLNKSMILDVVTKYLVHLKDENDKHIKRIVEMESELNRLSSFNK